ncbi:hypothetical protein [Haloferax sp. DFSO60]|uniref:hypothetical protein n=1 Tax=Haloferax sp. DFSO60 TaxID=3388652 RepID=UPI00397BF424
MTLRSLLSDRAFRFLVFAGAVASATNLVATFVESSELALFDAALQFVFVAVFGVLLVTYWNYMERRAAA